MKMKSYFYVRDTIKLYGTIENVLRERLFLISQGCSSVTFAGVSLMKLCKGY
jgi:hypothetical protein